jgi:type VI secretion system FHA domain protein
MAPPSRADSLDQLFDLGFANAADPFAATPAALPKAQPNTLADKDPLRAFGLDAAPAPAALPDHLSDLHTPWQSPSLTPASASPPTPATPQGAVLSWQQPSRDGKLVTLPGQPRPATAPADPFSVPGATTIAHSPRPDPALRPATPTPAPPAAAPVTPSSAQVDAWRQALADGLGMPAERLGPLTPEQLHLIGQLLRAATAGVVELLVARAELKRAMRTDVTMIGATENNALKFSPHVDVALNHLLGPPMTGFMPPARAMRDAFDDLRAHQMGVMAGMQAALDGVLARFEPAQLENKIAARRSALAALMPSTRKAQLWEQFQQLYAQLSAEATDDFQALFGKAFAKAYQAHIEAMQDDRI